jgi:hypothetical protein
VLVFLAIISTGLQYVIQRINYSRDLARVERIVKEARLAAWGPKMTPTNHPRKVKVNLGESEEGGKWIEMIVDGDSVYIVSGTRISSDNNNTFLGWCKRGKRDRRWFSCEKGEYSEYLVNWISATVDTVGVGRENEAVIELGSRSRSGYRPITFFNLLYKPLEIIDIPYSLSMAQVYHNDLLAPFLALPQGDKIQAEYVWIDGDGGLRSKTTVTYSIPLTPPLCSPLHTRLAPTRLTI